MKRVEAIGEFEHLTKKSKIRYVLFLRTSRIMAVVLKADLGYAINSMNSWPKGGGQIFTPCVIEDLEKGLKINSIMTMIGQGRIIRVPPVPLRTHEYCHTANRKRDFRVESDPNTSKIEIDAEGREHRRISKNVWNIGS
jgi:hypothetical protein